VTAGRVALGTIEQVAGGVGRDKAARHRPEQRPIFVLVLRPEPRVDGIRALRRLLKVSLRSFRLRCISIDEVRR
jgi:hypothetical protein